MTTANDPLNYGQFSVSLNVKDIHKSHEFYTTLGFKEIAGDINQKWIILSNDCAVIGLFEGMFSGNMMTFNPKDVRGLYKSLKAKGIEFTKEPEGESGPSHTSLVDPDGNVILLDQH